MNKKIFIIEDNEDLARLLEIHLRDVGFAVELSHDGKSGFDKARHQQFDLVILDLMLPDCSGLDVCKQLRGLQKFVPILMLTSRSSELDRVMGLEAGADDYLTKPFSVPELLARIKALLRRVDVYQALDSDPNKEQTINHHDLTINLEKHIVTIADQSILLTAKEFDLLVLFARHPGHVFTRTQLLDKVWGYSHEGYEHTVNSHINRLRLKVEKNPREPQYILTVWGVGYKFNDLLGSAPC